jgi:N-glycosylase/DNA lyase
MLSSVSFFVSLRRGAGHAAKRAAPNGLLQKNFRVGPVCGHRKGAAGSLRALARAYFTTQVAGQAKATIEAKRRNLARFIAFYEALYHHDHPDEWYTSVTREFLKQLARNRRAQATIVRTYASVRHFARWIHQKAHPFPLGCPVDGIEPRG